MSISMWWWQCSVTYITCYSSLTSRNLDPNQLFEDNSAANKFNQPSSSSRSSSKIICNYSMFRFKGNTKRRSSWKIRCGNSRFRIKGNTKPKISKINYNNNMFRVKRDTERRSTIGPSNRNVEMDFLKERKGKKKSYYSFPVDVWKSLNTAVTADSLHLAVCSCDAFNKADECGRRTHCVISQPFSPPDW